jgi:cyclopropane fatty-acyl-phospholipid synthase-like methyltransferase
MTVLFFEMFTGLPRQGPGDDTSTRRALSLVSTLGPTSRVLDIGCGTGAQTRTIARESRAAIVAIDNHAPYIDELKREALRLGIADRIEARVADMQQLELPPASFDLIWCEGAIYVVGFENGLRQWRRLLAPSGHLAITEVCWTTSNPPAPCTEFWEREYPAIRDVPSRLAAIADCGYEVAGHFSLPPSSWWDNYYRPLQENIDAFRERHRDDGEAQGLADSVQREIDVWHAYAEFYSYEFFVMRAP